MEWAKRGLRVNAVASGYIATSLFDTLNTQPELIRHEAAGMILPAAANGATP